MGGRVPPREVGLREQPPVRAAPLAAGGRDDPDPAEGVRLMSPAHPILAETLLSFADAAASLPAVGGRATSVKTLYRWSVVGVKVAGERVLLEACKLGGKRVTSA